MKSKTKHIGSFLLLIALAIILSHAFVPHHWHNGQGIIKTSECEYHHHNELPDHTSSCSHSHSESEDSHCVLHDLLVIPGKQIRADQPYVATTLQKTYCSLLVNGFFDLSLNSNVSNWLYHIKGTIPLPTVIFTSTKGLRAPPLV